MARTTEEVADLKALSVYQPWGWAIAEGHKPIENRTKRPGKVLGGLLVLHGAQIYDGDAEREIRKLLGLERLPLVAQRRGLLAVVRVRAVVEVGRKPDGSFDLLGFDGDLDRAGAFAYLESPWLSGPKGWICETVLRLPERSLFEDVRGWPGVFSVPAPASRAIRLLLDEAGVSG